MKLRIWRNHSPLRVAYRRAHKDFGGQRYLHLGPVMFVLWGLP